MTPKLVLEVDADSNVAYIQLTNSAVARTVEVSESVLIDLDEFGVAVGIEVLSLAAEIPFTDLKTTYHVHSEVIEQLRTIRPTVGAFMSLEMGSDGESSPVPQMSLTGQLASC